MAASCAAIEQMTEVQQEGLQGEEKKAEEIIDRKTASQYRKELAQNKTSGGKELTSTQREMREGKLAAYDVKMKAIGKRGVHSRGKWIKQIGSIKNDTEAIKGTTQAFNADTTCILGLLNGQEVERDADQSEKERLKQIRTIKR